ncbi:MAG: HAD-IC family P-type ATPase [Oscillospiraceae bacterium]|jgi:cation-transporting ATPase E|nr:HAD-IC family P-type ATPase [Oscillospiraceae bacterium]
MPTIINQNPNEKNIAFPTRGLTAAQVYERTDAGLCNIPVDAPTKSVAQIIMGNLFTYFNLVFAALSVVIILVGAWRELLFLPVVLINAAIGIVQEIRAKHTLDKLNLLNSPKALVIRDGTEQEIEAVELVLDDCVIFKSGQQICADAIVLEGEIQVNESLITGEPDEVLKAPGMSLLSGSYVVAGKCIARLEKVGADSFVSKLTLEAKASKKLPKSEMMKSLSRLVLAIGILIIPVGAGLFYHQYAVLGEDLRQSVITTVAALVGMIPEGLYLLTSVALAVSVIRLGKKKTLVRELSRVETLARVDMLCVDKTGTITEAEMLVEQIIPLVSDLDVSQILASHVLNLGTENETMKALKKYLGETPAKRANATLPFNSKNKFSAALYDHGECYLLGAPEFLLTESLAEVEPLAGQGLRVLLLARTDSFESVGSAIPVALVALSNKIRRNAGETFRYFAEQGVEIKVISGDNPHTVSNIAAKAGIANADKFIDAAALGDDQSVVEAAAEYTVFGRVTPEQKRTLIKALKAAGHTVAMTGDGVNDLLALKEADCSIAMASGSEVATQASDIVLLNNDFSSMPGVVDEGRRVINNIQRSASLFLVKNIFSFVFAILSIAAGFAYPVSPAQLSLVSTMTIGIPSFILALEPNSARIKGHFLRGVLFRALPGGLADVFLVFGVTLFTLTFSEISFEQSGTICAILLAVTGFAVMWRVCRPFTLLRQALCAGVAVLLVLCVTLFREIFALSSLGLPSVLIVSVFALLSYPMIAAISRILDKIYKIYEKGIYIGFHK